MNDVYGVDPYAPTSANELISLLRLFGPSEGRFIADFPMDWIAEVRSSFGEDHPMAQARALEWLHRRRHAFVATRHRYLSGRTWPENAAALHNEVRALIGARGCAPTQMSIDDALYGVDAIADAIGALIPRTHEAYVGAAWPLLSISPKVVLVDPYFRLRGPDRFKRDQAARHERVLSALLAEAQRRRKVEVFRICVSARSALEDDPRGAAFETDLCRVASAENIRDITLEYVVLEDFADPRQHARYLLGRGCGIQFDHGFDTARDGSTNHVHWLKAAELTPLLERFDLPDA